MSASAAPAQAPTTGAPNQGALDMTKVTGQAAQGARNAEEMIRRLNAGQDPYGRDQPTQQADQSDKGQQVPQDPPKPTNPTPERQPLPGEQQRQEAAPQPQPQPQQQPQQQGENWEHKFNSLNGRVQSLNNQISTLREENASLRNIISTFESMGRTAPAPTGEGGAAQGVAQAVYDTLTDEQRQEYGEEFVDVVQRAVAPLLQEIKNQQDQLARSLGGVTRANAQTAQEKMHEALDKRVPNWRDVNAEEGFVSWLEKSARYTRQPRGELLLQAYNLNDAATVAAFFEDFLTEQGRQGELPEAPQPQANAPRQGSSSRAGNGLEKFAAPGPSKGGATGPAATQASDKPSFTRQQISQFFAEKHRGAYRGREEEAARIEKEIFAATAEGRVR